MAIIFIDHCSHLSHYFASIGLLIDHRLLPSFSLLLVTLERGWTSRAAGTSGAVGTTLFGLLNPYMDSTKVRHKGVGHSKSLVAQRLSFFIAISGDILKGYYSIINNIKDDVFV